MRSRPMIYAVDVVISKRMHTMNVECPHCGGWLIEKQEEVENERGKKLKRANYMEHTPNLDRTSLLLL